MSLYAKSVDCDYDLLSMKVDSQTTTKELLETIASYCSKSLVIKDSLALQKIQEELFGIHINDLPLDNILNLLLEDKGLSYTSFDDIIKISALQTKTFRVDYVNSIRNGNSNTDINLNGASNDNQDGSQSSLSSGTQIISSDEFIFWKEIQKQLSAIINTPEDSFEAQSPIINQESGLVTVTATKKQLQRVEQYLQTLMTRLHKQVLIDVNILYVTLDDSQTTGIDWSQLFSQTLDAQIDYTKDDTGSSFSNSISGSFSLSSIISFLKTIGDVRSISNPKILTLSNQPALISSGEEIFYKITSTSTTTTESINTTTDEQIKSIFAGVLLDITPAITDNDEIILKINPSISSLKNPSENIEGTRQIPPDLLRKQLSSVVKLKNGQRVILGGLIEKTRGTTTQKVPLLGSLPLLGIPFKYEESIDENKELVIIITPHIITNDSKNVSLQELGYKGVAHDISIKGN